MKKKKCLSQFGTSNPKSLSSWDYLYIMGHSRGHLSGCLCYLPMLTSLKLYYSMPCASTDLASISVGSWKFKNIVFHLQLDVKLWIQREDGIYWKNLHRSGAAPVKPMLSKGRLYCLMRPGSVILASGKFCVEGCGRPWAGGGGGDFFLILGLSRFSIQRFQYYLISLISLALKVVFASNCW